ncbi:hypothetical protein ONA24_01595 [Mycoplasmopsis cynos]|uniref:hypothetical protein n=1 Tax=Mycoplasmopsis cynos TaxID=171284 RepID=UPI0024C80F9B|nr:hypothetical protein [Mycoplasmopsis cynos]WAM09996.1 hypothetical protein ONA24_01595 [Mycoplasmopsis cynos]
MINLKKEVDNYKSIADKINLFVNYTSSNDESEDLSKANEALNELKTALWDKLVNTAGYDEQEQLRRLVDANIELYNETKMLNGDILAVVNFLKDLKTKTMVEQINLIKNKIQPYKDQLKRFWTMIKVII